MPRPPRPNSKATVGVIFREISREEFKFKFFIALSFTSYQRYTTYSGKTESLLRGGGGKWGGQTFIWEGGQEDGIAMKGAQSKVKWGANGGGGPMV